LKIEFKDAGNFAVAWTGWKDTEGSGGIGDGVKVASSELVTRCRTKAEAEALADKLNAEEGHPYPGAGMVRIFSALRYRREDYTSRQDRENWGAAKCHRAIYK
jgi:hypothetical protein